MSVFTVFSPPNKPLLIKTLPITPSCFNNSCNLQNNISICIPVSTISAVSKLQSERGKWQLHGMPLEMVASSSVSSGSGYSWMRNNPETKEVRLHAAIPTATVQVASEKDLIEFICKGPLLDKVGLTSDMVAKSIDEWVICGSHLCRLLKLDENSLTEPQIVRIYHYYIPVYMWCQKEISHHRSKFKDEDDVPPLVIGFSAPQGCGKSTLVSALDFLFHVSGRKTATIAIDDFYLTHEDQATLRESNPGNALLEFRGNAGSHDLALSVETMSGLTKLSKEGTKMKLPRYNKSAYNGRGDRADPSTWPEIEGPLTAILFEGWMLGFKPLPDEVVKEVDPQLETVNKNLKAYYDVSEKFVNSWVVIKIQDPNWVYQWRLQAEISMKAAGKAGMSDEEIMDFVSRYIPAYKAYLPTLYAEGPSGSDPNHLLVVEIDEGRSPILGVY